MAKSEAMAVLVIVLVSVFWIVGIVPEEASASVSNVEFDATLYGNDEFDVWVDWIYTSYDEVEVRLYHNSVLVDTSGEWTGSSGYDWGYVSHEPAEQGTYKVQLWSNYYSTEISSEEYEVPCLGISLYVSPTSGQIGTTFVAEVDIFTGYDAPDTYGFDGDLRIFVDDADTGMGYIIILQSTYKSLEPGERAYFDKGFTLSTEGLYTVSAHYLDSFTSIFSNDVTIEVIDQYSPQITKLENELNNTKDDLESTSKELDDTKNKLSEVEDELNTTKEKLEDVESELSDTNEDLKSTKDSLIGTKEELAITRDELNSTKDELNGLEVELNNIKNELAIVVEDLKNTKTSLGISLSSTKEDLKKTKEDLNTTKDNLEYEAQRLSDTTDELNDGIDMSRQYAYIGIAVGLVSIILIFLIIVIMAIRRKKVIEPPQQYSPQKQHPLDEHLPRQDYIPQPPMRKLKQPMGKPSPQEEVNWKD